jgi:hypothetical protein
MYNNYVTVFVVLTMATRYDYQRIFGQGGYTSANLWLGWYQPWEFQSGMNGNQINTNNAYPVGGFNFQVPQSFLISYGVNSSGQTAYFSGTPIMSSGYNGTYAANNPVSSIGTSGGLNFFTRFRELLLFQGAMSDTERQKVEAYLAYKWGYHSTSVSSGLYSPKTYLILNSNSTDTGSSPITVTNSNVSFTNCEGKYAAYFNNSSSTYLSFPFSYGTSYTITFWLNHNGSGNPLFYTSTALNGTQGMFFNAGNNSQWYLNFSGGQQMVFNNRTDARAWNHIALTVNTTTGFCQGYINNTYSNSNGSITGSGSLSNMSNFYLGQNWGGYIQFFSVYTSILTSTQITNIYNSQINSLPQSSAYFSSQPTIPSIKITTTFSPTTVSGLNAWYDASDPLANGSPPGTGTNITTWYDKSGNNYNSTSINSGSIPIQNDGYYYLNFTNNYYNIPAMNWTINNYFTFFIVEQGNNNGWILGTSNYNNFNSWTTLLIKNTVVQVWGIGTQYNLPNYDNSRTHVWSITFTSNPVPYSMAVYLNGSYITPPSGASPWSSYLTANPISIIGGDGWDSSGAFYNGKLREIIGYQININTSQRQNIEGYLAWKYNTHSLLPASHPYYAP